MQVHVRLHRRLLQGNGAWLALYSLHLLSVWCLLLPHLTFVVISGFLCVLCNTLDGTVQARLQTAQTKFYVEEGRSSNVPKPYFIVSDGLRPDFWLEPVQVWEIRGADLTLSPVHTAGAGYVDTGDGNGVSARGVSLRFPRFIRVRDDKGIEDATTGQEIASMYVRQLKDGGHRRVAPESNSTLKEESAAAARADDNSDGDD
eukprot:Opistho-2@5453